MKRKRARASGTRARRSHGGAPSLPPGRGAAERDLKVIQQAKAEAEAAAALAAPIEEGETIDADLVETPESRE